MKRLKIVTSTTEVIW